MRVFLLLLTVAFIVGAAMICGFSLVKAWILLIFGILSLGFLPGSFRALNLI